MATMAKNQFAEIRFTLQDFMVQHKAGSSELVLSNRDMAYLLHQAVATMEAQENTADWCDCEEELEPLGIVYCVACNGIGEDPNHNGAMCPACDGEGIEK